MKYYIIAGEASGDLHGSNLMKGLKTADPEAEFRFWGGDLMSSQGGVLVKHYKETAVMGFVEVLASIRKISINLSLCKKDLLEYNPDILILIDYPGFNFRIAKFAKQNGIKVFYYISPKVWAWKESRIENLRRDVDKLFIIFPFEIEYFKKHKIEAIYNGNPLLDSIAQSQLKKESSEEFRKRIGLDDKPIIGLLAGSRAMEIKYLLPRMVKLEKLLPGFNYLLAGAPSTDVSTYQKYLKNSNIKLLFSETYNILSHARVSVLSSGTASLEAALLDAPQVVCYGGNEISYQIAKRLIKVKYASLVNLILDQPLVKELLQHDCTPEKIAEEVKSLLNDKRRERVLKKYSKVREMLGGEGASVKVAKSMVEQYREMLNSQRFTISLETPLGLLKLVSDNEYLLEVNYIDNNQTISNDAGISDSGLPEVLKQARDELTEYFKNQREIFEIPIKPIGTEFQNRVWSELKRIPYGEVRTYGDIAKNIGTPDAGRAVGMACKMNPLLVVVPCHRVLGAHNRLTGFNIGLEKKGFLLDHEKAYAKGESNLFSQNKGNENEN
ncbi:MAG: lipid-A-disaccharide synthase [Bacteroidales bacterium]|jgi:lipid-A-disaccharide synthase|nr:lipid-A-disaccharide synthase [Bacteroidales bacterium]